MDSGTFVESKKSLSIAEILMPKLEEHASNLTLILSAKTLSGESYDFV